MTLPLMVVGCGAATTLAGSAGASATDGLAASCARLSSAVIWFSRAFRLLLAALADAITLVLAPSKATAATSEVKAFMTISRNIEANALGALPICPRAIGASRGSGGVPIRLYISRGLAPSLRRHFSAAS
jgi:hypothetical protein